MYMPIYIRSVILKGGDLMADTIEIDVMLNMKDNTSSGLAAAKSNIDKFTHGIDKAKEKIDKLGGTNAKPSVSLVDKASSSLNKITSGLKGFAGKTFRASVKVIDYATRPLRAIKNTLFSLKTLALTVGAGLIGKKVIADPIGLADQYSSAKIGFSTLLGDKQGQKMMDDIDKFAKETPFKTSNTTEQAQRLVAMGWDAKNIIRDMKTIGDAAAATGKGDEGLSRIALALSQIKSKGKLSTEELNQLAEAGISAKRYIAEGLGYGSGDSALQKMSKDLEQGKIGAEAAIDAILKGMKEYDGMMKKTANETVEGLKSQIEDTFEINVLRKWGQGLQDGAKKGFGSIVEFLDKNEGRLSRLGDTLNGIGKELSSWAADKIEDTLDKVMRMIDDPAFKNASLFGKMKIAWDELIAEPFGQWWDSNGYPFFMKKAEGLGKGLGEGLSGILKGLLGLAGGESDIAGEATSIGGSFAKGFMEGFDADGVVDSLGKAFKKGFKALFSGNWLSNLILASLSIKLTNGLFNILSSVKGLWLGSGAGGGLGAAGAGASGIGYVGGLKGLLGGASTASGVLEGSGLIGGLAKVGSLAGSTAYTGGGLALAGAGTVAGTVLGGIGAYKGAKDLYSAYKSDNSNDIKHYKTRGYTKLGMVGTGAAIGTMITPGVGTAIGAGIGGLAALLTGNKLADKISGVTKSTKELRQEAERLKSVNMQKHFGNVELSAQQLQKRVTEIIGSDTISRVNKFNESMQNLSNSELNLDSNSDSIAYFHERIMGNEKLSSSDVDDYSNSITNYTSSLKEYLKLDKSNARSAFQLLYGDDTKGLQKMTKSMNSQYTKLEKDLDKKTKKLNKVMEKAFKDGKITPIEEKEIAKILNQIDDIEQKIKNKKEESERNARYDLIEKKYKDTDLTADSYKAMIDELNAQNEVDLKAYDDAYVTAKAKIDLQLEDGTINKATYDKKLKEIEDKWLNGKTETLKRTYEVTFDVVKSNYSGEFDNIKKAIEGDSLSKGAKNVIDKSVSTIHGLKGAKSWGKEQETALNDAQDAFLKSAGIDEKVQVQMKDLYESMKPQEKELKALKKQYTDAGKNVPEWISDGLNSIDQIKLMSGDKGIFQKMLGKQMVEEDAAMAADLLTKNGKNLPKALKKGIEEGLKEQEDAKVKADVQLDANIKKIKVDGKKLDDETAKSVKALSKKDLIEVDKNGKVKIKAKGGIDYDDVDKKTQEQLDKLKDAGLINIDKNGKVTIKAKGKPDTKNVDKAAIKAINKLKNKGILKVDKKGKVTVTKKGSVNVKNLDKATKKEIDKLEKKGIIKITKDGKIKVVAKKVDTAGAKDTAEKKTKEDVGKTQNVDKSVNVTDKHNSTDTSDAKTKSQSKTKEDLKGPFTVSSLISVSMGLAGITGLGSIVSSVVSKAKSALGKIDLSGGSKRQFANGGFSHGPESIEWGEDGPEVIIPLSAKRRQRGLELLKKTNQIMGVRQFADGGFSDGEESKSGSSFSKYFSNDTRDNTETSHTTARNNTGKIEVNVGGITIEIPSSGDGAAADIMNSKDKICTMVAEALEEAFQNLPLATE